MEITRAASPTALAQPYAAPAKSLAINWFTHLGAHRRIYYY